MTVIDSERGCIQLGPGKLYVQRPDGSEQFIGFVNTRIFGRDGAHRRFFWRVRHRIGPGWDKLDDKTVRRLLRQMSWRRAH